MTLPAVTKGFNNDVVDNDDADVVTAYSTCFHDGDNIDAGVDIDTATVIAATDADADAIDYDDTNAAAANTDDNDTPVKSHSWRRNSSRRTGMRAAVAIAVEIGLAAVVVAVEIGLDEEEKFLVMFKKTFSI